MDLFLFSMIMLGVGCGPQVGPFLSRPTKGSIRGEGTPPQTLAVIWKKKGSSFISSGCSRKDKEGNQPPPPPPHHHVPPPCSPPSPALPTGYLRAAFQPPPPPLPPPHAAVTAATARSLHFHLPSSSTDPLLPPPLSTFLAISPFPPQPKPSFPTSTVRRLPSLLFPRIPIPLSPDASLPLSPPAEISEACLSKFRSPHLISPPFSIVFLLPTLSADPPPIFPQFRKSPVTCRHRTIHLPLPPSGDLPTFPFPRTNASSSIPQTSPLTLPNNSRFSATPKLLSPPLEPANHTSISISPTEGFPYG